MIKHASLFLAVLVLCTTCWSAQNASTSKLSPRTTAITNFTGMLRWESNFRYEDSDPKPESVPLTASSLAKYIGSSKYVSSVEPATKAELALRKKYQKSLQSLVANLTCSNGSVYYFNDTFSFAEHKGRTCLVLYSIVSPKIWNTLRLNSHQRAAQVFNYYVPDLTASILKSFKFPGDIHYYSVSIIYGAGDASDDSGLATHAEALTVTAASVVWAKFAKALITDQQFADRAEVVLTESSGSREKRIGIRLAE